MKILAATDFSTEGDEAIRQADAWVRAWDGELLVTCFDRHRAAAEARLEECVARLTGRTPDRTLAIVEEGSPASRLPALAVDVDAGLIVVPGTSRRWRSIARRVVHHAQVSVLVARPPAERGLVLFASDLSPSTPQPLWVASEEARRRGAKLVMLNVHDLGDAVEEWMGTGFGRLDGQLGAGLHSRLHRRLRAALSDALAASAVVGEPRVVDGEPAEGIVHAAETLRPALLVIGSTVWSPLRHLLGSVTEGVVRAAPCPVLVVRPGTQWSAPAPSPVGEMR